jgi:hypothetical protein
MVRRWSLRFQGQTFARLRGGVLVVAALAATVGVLELLGVVAAGRWPLDASLTLNGLASAAAWRLAGLVNDDERSLSLVIDSSVIMLALIVLVATALGTLGWLELGSVMAVTGVIAAGVWGLLPARRTTASQEGASRGPAGSTAWVWGVLVGLLVFEVAQMVWTKWLIPPMDDALRYHLPYAVEWIQHGDLRMPVPPAGDPYTPFGPLNASLWMTWLMLPFRSDVMVRFVQVPFAALMALAVVQFARDLELPEPTAWVSGLLVVSLPDVMRQAFVVGNDVIMATLLLLATVYVARLWQSATLWRLLLGATVLGLALGTKVPALPYVGVLFLIQAAAVAKGWRSRGWGRVLLLWLLAGGIVLALGGYSHVRNLIVQGNPFYPVRLALGGREIAPGLFAVTAEWKRRHPYYPFDWLGLLFRSRVAFGWTITLWALPGLVLAVPRLVAERRLDLLAVLGWIAAAFGLFWFVVPYHFARFLYAHVAWVIVVATWGWQGILKRRSPWLTLLAVPLVAVNAASIPKYAPAWQSPAYWLAAAAITGVVAGVVVQVQRWLGSRGPGRRRWLLVAFALLMAVPVVAWPVYARLYERRRFDAWSRHRDFLGDQPAAWAWLASETRRGSSVIVAAGTNVTYPLYGPELRNEVVRITPDGYASEYGWGRPYHAGGQPDRAAWLATLDEEGVAFLYTTPDVVVGGWPLEDGWAAGRPDRFELAFANEDVHVWRVMGACLATNGGGGGWPR